MGPRESTSSGFEADLDFTGAACDYYGEDIPQLRLQVDYETNTRLHVKIVDAAADRWEVPDWIVPRSRPSQRAPAPEYVVSTTDAPFGFSVSRTSGAVVFNSTAPSSDSFRNVVFEDQYLEMSTVLPADAAVYGLGERVRPFRLSTGLSYTMWTADEATPVNQNVYGVHPFYMVMSGGRAHGVVRI